MFSETLIRYFFFYIFCIGVAISLLPDANAEVIRVNRHVTVSDNRDLFLIDIVDKNGLNAEILEAIKNVKITNAPNAGERRVLSNRSLSKLLRKSIQQVKKQTPIRLKIPSEVVIENHGKGFSKKSARARITKSWKSMCEECEFKLDMLSLPNIPADNFSTWAIQVNELPKGPFTYAVVMTDTDGRDHKYWVQGQARVFKLVAVTTRHLSFGQTIGAGDIRLELREVTFAYDKPLKKDEAIGKQLRRTIAEGYVVWQNSVQVPFSVKRGQPVKLTLEDDGWSLSMPGVSQDQGRIGDTVSVRNPRSNKLLTGKVVREGEVLVR